jgi:hypothetical protein
MSMPLPVACPRCGESNRVGRRTCWVCEGDITAAVQSVSDGVRTILTISLKIAGVIIIGSAVVGALGVALILVTCFGSANNFGR